MIAPWREWNIRSREDALAYAAAHDVPVDQSPRDLFSRDGNLWHLSHEGGNLEDTWNAPLKEMFKLTVDPQDAPGHARRRSRSPSSAGTPVSLDGQRLGPGGARRELNRVAGAHGVGRLDLVENRLVGIKSRGVYETPAGTVLHLAHRELERLVLDRNTLHFKQSVSVRYAQLIYDGLWFSTLREALAAFVDYTEKEVTGEVRVKLFKGRAEAIGRRSPRSLYRQDLATFGEGMAYDHQDAEGFIRLFGLPERVRALTRDRMPVDVKAVEVDAPSTPGRRKRVSRRRRVASHGRHRPRASGRRRWPRASSPAASTWRCWWPTGPARPPASSPRTARRRRRSSSRASTSAAGRARAVVVNAGCANAATGERGPARTRARWRPGRGARSACSRPRGRGGVHGRHRGAACPWTRCGRASRARGRAPLAATAARTPRAPS